MAERRQLGFAAAVAAVTGQSIALGIFLTPATMAKSLGSPLLLAAVWCAMAGMTVCGALCYSELAVRFPEAGGEYVYLREGYGGRAAFLYGWMSAAVMDPGLAAALAVGATSYVQTLTPLEPMATALFPAGILLCLAVVNILGTRLSGGLMTAANLLKIAVLFGLVGWAITAGGGSLDNLLPLAERRAGSGPLLPAIAGAVVSAFFSFGGWWEAGKLAGEIRDPEKNLPRAFTGGVLLVTGIYLLISFAFLYVLPLEQIVSNTAFVAQFGGALFGAAGAKVLSACVLLSVFGGLLALTMAAPRAYYAMARDGAFFPPFGRLHPRFGTPVNAILLQTGLALVLLTLGAFDRILSYIVFSAVMFLGLSATALFRLRPPVVRWWFPAAPILFVAGCFVVGLLILLNDPLPALLGVAVVLAGDVLRRFFMPFWATALALAVCSLLITGCHNAPPRSPQVVADSISGFSGEQGANGWSYGYWDYTADTDKSYSQAADFQLLPHFGSDPINQLSARPELGTGSKLWTLQDGQYYTSLWAGGGHPNGNMEDLRPRARVEHWAVRRWVSTANGPVTISGRAAKVLATNWGGGVQTRIVVDGTTVFSSAIGNSGTDYSVDATVHSGSLVDFLIGPGLPDAYAVGVTEFTGTIRTASALP